MGTYSLDLFTSFNQRFGPISPLAAYDDTTDVKVDMRSMNDKVVVVKNLSNSTGLTYTILGSIDSSPEQIEWDFVETVDTVVAPLARDIKTFSSYYTYILIRIKGAGSSALVKVAATPN